MSLDNGNLTFGDGPFEDGQTYQGSDGCDYVYKNGCFVIAAPEDVDTFAAPGQAEVAGTDAYGVPYEQGANIVMYPGGAIVCIPEKVVDTDTDTWGVPGFAPTPGTDEYGVSFDQGDKIVTFPDGKVICVPNKTVDTDTFAVPLIAATAGTDAFGIVYNAGDKLVEYPNGDFVCIPEKVVDTDTNTYAIPGQAAQSGVDVYGVPYAAGDNIINYPGGEIVCVPPKVVDTDTFAAPITATESGTDAFGVAYEPGDNLVIYPDGRVVCVPDKVTDTDTFADPQIADSAGVDEFGVAYDAGDNIIVYPDGQIVCVPEKVVDTDTFAMPITAIEDGTDAFGVNYQAGDNLVVYPGGGIVCIPDKVEDTNTDTFALPGVASSAGTDAYGVPYAAGDNIINYPDGSTVCVPPKVIDTFAVPSVADVAGTDAYGVAYDVGDNIVTYPGGQVVCIPAKVTDTDTDTFGVPGPAPVDGVDAFGVPFVAGDNIVTFPGGNVICVPEKVVDTDTDTFGTTLIADTAGTDVFGVAYDVGANLIELPGGVLICVPEKTTPAAAPEFIYVDYDPSVHVPGPVVGDGTPDMEVEIPLIPPKECNFSYVDFDPAIHGATDSGDSPIAGDGTVDDPWQIPRPCCEESCAPLSATCDLAAEQIPAGGAGGTTNFGLTTTVLDRGNEGFSAFVPGNPNAGAVENSSLIPQVTSAAGLDIPVPAATPGCVLSLQIAWGGETNSQRGVNLMGDLVYSVNSADVANDSQVHYNNTSDSGQYGTVILMDAVTGNAGGFVNVMTPNYVYFNGRTDAVGVINWQWLEICADDGQPLTTADYNNANDVAYNYADLDDPGSPYTSDTFTQDADCDGLAWVWGRHVLGLGAGDIEMITDADWLQFTGATELTDTTSWDVLSGSPCQAGMGSAFIQAGSSWSVDASGNRSTSDPAWIDQGWIHGGTFDCERMSAGGASGETAVKTLDWTAPCDGDVSCSVTGTVDVTVAAGEVVTLTPTFGGVADASQAIVVTASGSIPVNLTGPTVTAVEGDTGACTFTLQAATTTGAGTTNAVDVNGLTMEISQ